MIPLDRVRAMLAAATPGPWRREREDGTIGSSVVVDAHDDQVADATGQAPMRDIERRPVHEVQRANAALIAAAPDLARDVLALAAALRTERAAREAAEAQHAALAGAVRAYLAAVDAHRAEKTRWQREYIPAEGVQRARIAEALAVVGTKRTALDAALATTTTTPKESR